jgi:hypothetical protein
MGAEINALYKLNRAGRRCFQSIVDCFLPRAPALPICISLYLTAFLYAPRASRLHVLLRWNSAVNLPVLGSSPT